MSLILKKIQKVNDYERIWEELKKENRNYGFMSFLLQRHDLISRQA